MDHAPTFRLIEASPPELLVFDEPGECAYLSDRIWRLPMRLPVRPLTWAELDQRLVAGDRRQGRLLYRVSCPSCQACQPIRIDVERFRPRRTQRRVLARGRQAIRTELGSIVVNARRLLLYNRHKHLRGLTTGEALTSTHAYRVFLGDSCCETFEIRYWVGGHLIGVAITDRASTSLSAVYYFFDPDYAELSPGVYSILRQIELCREWGLRHLYLGLYIGECRPMQYKARFRPHERRVDGRWCEFDELPPELAATDR